MINSNQQTVVIDKSYLYAAKKCCVTKLATTHKLLICESFIFETVKDAPRKRSTIISKLPSPPSGWEYIPSVSWLINYERTTNSECKRPSTHIKNRDYSMFNQLVQPESTLPPKNKAATVDHENFIKKFRDSLILNMEESYQKNNKKQAQERLKRLLSGEIKDEKKINELIFSSKGANIPSIQRFSPNSVTFRFFQILELYTADMLVRYESPDVIKNSPKALEKVLHDTHDLNYLILALLEGRFATQEKKLQLWWNAMEDESRLIVV